MFLTSQTSYYKGQATLLCFRGSMSGTSRRIRLMTSVSVLCAEKQNTFLYPLSFSLVAFTSFSRNHYTACQLQFTKGIINRERFSAHLDSMLGTWVNIRAMISELPPSAASCNEFHPPLFIRHRSASLFIKPLTVWTYTPEDCHLDVVGVLARPNEPESYAGWTSRGSGRDTHARQVKG